MIKLPYYNENDVDLFPIDSKLRDGAIYANGFSLTFEKKDTMYLRMDIKSDYYGYGCYSFGCGDFTGTIKYNSSSVEIDGTWKKDLKIAGNGDSNTGWKTWEVYFSQQEDGLKVSVIGSGFTFEKVYPGLKIGNLTFGYGYNCWVRNIVASESKNDMYFASTQDITVDSIDNWELNSANEYVLTNIDKTGVVHISQEKLDKLLADNDIISCAIVMTTEKRGTKLKNMEFAVGDTKNTVEIPTGKSKIMIPLSFKNGTDMKNISLTVRG